MSTSRIAINRSPRDDNDSSTDAGPADLACPNCANIAQRILPANKRFDIGEFQSFRNQINCQSCQAIVRTLERLYETTRERRQQIYGRKDEWEYIPGDMSIMLDSRVPDVEYMIRASNVGLCNVRLALRLSSHLYEKGASNSS